MNTAAEVREVYESLLSGAMDRVGGLGWPTNRCELRVDGWLVRVVISKGDQMSYDCPVFEVETTFDGVKLWVAGRWLYVPNAFSRAPEARA